MHYKKINAVSNPLKCIELSIDLPMHYQTSFVMKVVLLKEKLHHFLK